MTDRGEYPARRHGPRNALRFLPIALVVAGLALAYAMGWQRYLSLEFLSESSDALRAWVDANPLLAPAVFFMFYFLAVAFAFPAASVLTIFGGFLFGWLQASILVAFAATAGAVVLFTAARTAFGDILRRRLGGALKRFADGFERDAFSYLLVLRLAPVFPFFVVNVAPAFFDIRLKTYAAATFIGILPGVFAYAWLGEGVGSVLEAARTAGREVGIGDLVTPQITLAFTMLALVAAIPAIVRHLRGRRGGA